MVVTVLAALVTAAVAWLAWLVWREGERTRRAMDRRSTKLEGE